MKPTIAEKHPEAYDALKTEGFTGIAEMMTIFRSQKMMGEALGVQSSATISQWSARAHDPSHRYEKKARSWLKAQRKTEPVPEPTYEPRPVPIAPPFPQIQHEPKLLMIGVNGNESEVRKALEFLKCEVFE
jgi:hypothetical protein